MSRSIHALAPAAVAAALVAAGCGGGGSGSSTSASNYGSGGGSATGEEKPASDEGGEAADISVASVGDLGKVLVEGKGMTVYDFHKDKEGMPSCYGACAQAWPPVPTTGMPQPGNGASASMLGTVERKDGTLQVTYAGHPLYTFVEDKKPGEANGNDVTAFRAQWYALKGSGEEAGD